MTLMKLKKLQFLCIRTILFFLTMPNKKKILSVTYLTFSGLKLHNSMSVYNCSISDRASPSMRP